jgi:hypothetical protein
MALLSAMVVPEPAGQRDEVVVESGRVGTEERGRVE